MLAGVPLSLNLSLAPRTVDEEVQRAGIATIWQAYVQCFLAAAKGTEVRQMDQNRRGILTREPRALDKLDEIRGNR